MAYKTKVVRQPEFKPITEFMRGQSSVIMREVEKQDNVVLVMRRNKPMTAVISYECYKELAEAGYFINYGAKAGDDK